MLLREYHFVQNRPLSLITTQPAKRPKDGTVFNPVKPALILDAMGVIYRSADDVAELLVPFVAEQGGTTDAEYIERQYHRASLSLMNGAEFWQSVGIPPGLEDNYLARHQLSPGLREFLIAIRLYVDSLWCLSNDLSEWSRKLRERHELSVHFAGFVISGEVGVRKPDRAIYQVLLTQVRRPAHECIFVDDRVKNLDAAKALGFQTVLFGSQQQDAPHQSIGSFEQLSRYLSDN